MPTNQQKKADPLQTTLATVANPFQASSISKSSSGTATAQTHIDTTLQQSFAPKDTQTPTNGNNSKPDKQNSSITVQVRPAAAKASPAANDLMGVGALINDANRRLVGGVFDGNQPQIVQNLTQASSQLTQEIKAILRTVFERLDRKATRPLRC